MCAELLLWIACLVLFGGGLAQSIYFAVTSHQLQSFFGSHDMHTNAHWALAISIFFCISALIFLVFLVELFCVSFEHYIGNREFVTLIIFAIVLIIFQLCEAIIPWGWKNVFDSSDNLDLARKCRALVGMQIGYLSLVALLILFLLSCILWENIEDFIYHFRYKHRREKRRTTNSASADANDSGGQTTSEEA